MTKETKILLDVYRNHGNIIIGVDFDDTIFPYTHSVNAHVQCLNTRELLQKLQPYATFCLWTVADNESLHYKQFITNIHYKLGFEYFNESPVTFGGSRKPYFNILLDDKAGLNEAISILQEFLQEVNI